MNDRKEKNENAKRKRKINQESVRVAHHKWIK